MPIDQNTPLHNLAAIIPGRVAAYNAPGSRTANYNDTYNEFIEARQIGVATHGGVHGWLVHGNAAASIHALLAAFGMNAQRSVLMPLPVLGRTLQNLLPASVQWIEGFALPIPAPCNTVNPTTGQSLSIELGILYASLFAPGAVTVSGGFVAASKTLHCLFPNLAPMIDGRHSGLSYFHILQNTYLPPLGLNNWAGWLGVPLPGVPNPSPRGAGRNSWDAARFMAAIGVNQHIYELWQRQNGNPGLQAFLALDPAIGTSGIPRVIDKLLW